MGLQPVTRHLDCPVNAAALAKYIRDAGHAADAPRHDGQGTLRERACKFIQSLNGKATVRIAYWHSLLGAELIASGFVVASREYMHVPTLRTRSVVPTSAALAQPRLFKAWLGSR